MTTLLVGFDSAWTRTHSGALVGALQLEDGTLRELGPPQTGDFNQAERVILEWQAEHLPTATIVLLDEPTIVKNAERQRPVDNLVCSSVSLRYGGMQPANLGREEMFGKEAPVWSFLDQFGGAADPLNPVGSTWVLETYPVLMLIALGWLLPDTRPSGRLPNYNPQRRKTFLPQDWQYLCSQASAAFRERDLPETAGWIDGSGRNTSPRKSDQDCLDACFCLLVALDLAQGKDCLMVGETNTGYIVVPYGAGLRRELETRCKQTGRLPADWVRAFRLRLSLPYIDSIDP